MKQHITELLQQSIEQLQQQAILPNDIQPRIHVERTKDKSHGDFATNLAMMLAKPAKKNPRELAILLIKYLPESAKIAKTNIAGPGFINFFVDQSALIEQLDKALNDEHLGIELPTSQTIVVDYSSPNLAKEMHVGHLRSSIIGDAVVKALEFVGHKVIRQNHVGDWGTQFGMLLAYMEELRTENKQNDELNLSDLENFYRAAKLRFDESADFANRARELVVALQSGDAYCNQLWKEFNDISLTHCHEVYERLGVSLTRDDVRGESCYNNDLPQIVAALKDKNLLTENQGAQCVFLDEFKNKEGEPLPIIVQKADGGYLYATSDLAAIRYRTQTLNADRVLYFVDMRQALHFQQVFNLAHKAGFASDNQQLEHMGFGTMNGPDGKPFKTRSGGTVKLIDLIKEAEQKAYALVKEKNPQLDDESLKSIAHVVGIGSVKYAELSKHRSSDYIFSFDNMLSFEGNTAPYLLYALTRVYSILDKANEIDVSNSAFVLEHDKEVELANKLMQFNDALSRMITQGTPNTLCSYLYDLAGTFSSFYEACPVLKVEQESVRDSRLKLSALTAKTLQQGFDILGLRTLRKM